MRKVLWLVGLLWAVCPETVLMAQTVPPKGDNAGKPHPRVVVRLVVEDKDETKDRRLFACIVKTEALGSERASERQNWARCGTDVDALQYYFTITRSFDDPSMFFFYAGRLPSELYPFRQSKISGEFVPPPPHLSGYVYFRLSNTTKPFFAMTITPFTDDASLQKWLAERDGLKGFGELPLTVGPSR